VAGDIRASGGDIDCGSGDCNDYDAGDGGTVQLFALADVTVGATINTEGGDGKLGVGGNLLIGTPGNIDLSTASPDGFRVDMDGNLWCAAGWVGCSWALARGINEKTNCLSSLHQVDA